MFKVCVHCSTYNQSQYINDALNGFVMQQTDFPFVAVIVDDASTDGEQEILRAYFEQNFNIHDSMVTYEEEKDYGTILFGQHLVNKNCYFAIVLLRENHYSQGKTKRPYISQWIDSATYIAPCEGDDYWTNPDKIQEQVSFLENHPDYGFVGTNNLIMNSGCSFIKEEKNLGPIALENGLWELYGNVFENAKYGPITRTATLCYRQSIVLPYKQFIYGDLTLQTVLSRFSSFANYKPFCVVYRSGIGISSKSNSLEKKLRYNEWFVKNKRLQKRLFPEECNWDEAELLDRLEYIRLKISIKDLDWRKALSTKKKLSTIEYKHKAYSKYLLGPITCLLLRQTIKND